MLQLLQAHIRRLSRRELTTEVQPDHRPARPLVVERDLAAEFRDRLDRLGFGVVGRGYKGIGRRGGQRPHLPDVRRAGDLLFLLPLGAAPGHGLAFCGEPGEVESNKVVRVGMISTWIYW